MGINAGDLSRAVVHDPSEKWPELMEIVAYWGPARTRRRSVTIDADQFFGRGRFGAPMSAEVLFGIVDKLRKEGSRRESVSKLRRAR